MHVSKPQHKHRSSRYYCRDYYRCGVMPSSIRKRPQSSQIARKSNELSSAYYVIVQLRGRSVRPYTGTAGTRLIDVKNSLPQSSQDQMCSIRPAKSKRERSATSTLSPHRGHFGRCERNRGRAWEAARNCASKIWYVGSVAIVDVSSRRTPGSRPLCAAHSHAQMA